MIVAVAIAFFWIGFKMGSFYRPQHKKWYYDYLDSPKWRDFRNTVFKRDGFRCVKCTSEMNLVCHHVNYKRVGNEQIQDCITLCEKCHKELHKKK